MFKYRGRTSIYKSFDYVNWMGDVLSRYLTELENNLALLTKADGQFKETLAILSKSETQFLVAQQRL